jgi:hypothetical protein
MTATFVQSLLRERLGELLAALDPCAQAKDHFSMNDARAVAQALDHSGAAKVTQSQAVTIVRFLRGKGKWRGIGPNPVYVGKAKGRFKSEYRVLPAGHHLIADSASGLVGSASAQPQNARRRKRHIQVLAAFQAAHPDGGSMSDLVASVIAVAPGATPMRVRRLAAVALRQGLLIQKARGQLAVAPKAVPEERQLVNRAFTRANIWLPIIWALPDRIRDSDHGFTAQDLHAASWSFGEFALDEVRLALRELVKAQYLTPASKRGRYILDAQILDLVAEEDPDRPRAQAPSHPLHLQGR